MFPSLTRSSNLLFGSYGNFGMTWFSRLNGPRGISFLMISSSLPSIGFLLELERVGLIGLIGLLTHQCLSLQPNHPQALTNLGNIYMEWNMMTAAAQCLQGNSNLCNLSMQLHIHLIRWPMLALEISGKYAAHYSAVASRFSLPAFNHPLPLLIKSTGGNNRLKIGSSDFRNHPLSHLMGSVFGMHNRENVEVFCYALSPNDGSEWRLHIRSEAEHFNDVSAMTSDTIARLINEDHIQILIKLNGYTKLPAKLQRPSKTRCTGPYVKELIRTINTHPNTSAKILEHWYLCAV
ncbi:probable UDP-N-acetylglucosamine--peptide N-acetylglucosaminyltransferase SEC [Tanacetum coccineum]